MNPPSGHQTVLVHGDQVAVIVEVGGGLRTYSCGDHEILDGYGRAEMCRSGRGQPLVPWPNRLAGGRYTFDRSTYQAAINEVEAGNAIHGLGQWRSWHVAQLGDAQATASLRIRPSPGYPFELDVVIDYALADDGLTVTTTGHNTGLRPCPYALGFHPYISAFGGDVDDIVLTAPGHVRYVTDRRGIPVGRERVEGTPWDFRSPRPIGALLLDTGYTDLARDERGRATVTFASPASGRTVRVWMNEAFTHLMLFSGDTVTEPRRRRRGLAIEPMTAAPDAFNSGDGLVVLNPGDSAQAIWGIDPDP